MRCLKCKTPLILLVFILVVSVFSGMSALGASNVASYDFGTGSGENITISSGAATVSKDGRNALYLNPSESKSYYINVKVDDSFLYDIPDYTPIEVTLEYYDEGEDGFFELAYDGYRLPTLLNGEHFHLEGRKGVWCHAPDIELSGSNRWKKAKFYLDNMKLSNRADGYDIRIGVWTLERGMSPEGVYIGSIKLEKLTTVGDPLRLTGTSDSEGNIFGDDVNLKMSYLNISERNITSQFEAKIIDSSGNEVWTDSWSYNFSGRETKIFDIRPQLAKYDIYTLHVDATPTYSGDITPSVTHSSDTEFSRVFGLGQSKNNMFGTALLISTYKWSEAGVSPQIAANAGIGWAREEIQWRTVEQAKGVYKIPDEMWQHLKDNKEAGIKTELDLVYGNTLYSNGQSVMVPPESDEYIAAYAAWCEWMARETKGYADAFCVWNEYDISNFNPTDVSDENYAKILKAVYPAIKRGNPNAIVVGLESAGFDLVYVENVFKAGGLDYMDVVGMHHYKHKPAELKLYSERLKALLEKYGHPNKSIWWTEFGYPQYDYNASNLYSKQESANMFVHAYTLMRGFDLADCAMEFRFCDELENSSRFEGTLGITNDYRDPSTPNGAKPAYLAISAMNNFIGSNAEVVEAKTNDDNTYVVKFHNDDMKRDIFVIGDMTTK